ncbi:MAG: VTT domain-containing protein [Intestinimonas sp.]|jgi:uncharacterized membrane protein YdjX (TVP38/TMEM64 family)|nr:VTT domain-containing protein [Intestinimonas sp.]
MKRLPRILTCLLIVFILGLLLFLAETGFFSAAMSMETMRAYIRHFSPYSQIIFFIIQLASVIVAPIPSNVTAAAGAVVFDMWTCFWLTCGAVLLGSVLVFWLARALGKQFVVRIVSKKLTERYLSIIQKKRDVFLALAFLLPFFPDDILCILAGLTDIQARRFFFIAVCTRPWGLLVSCAVGSSLLSFTPAGLIFAGSIGVELFLLGLKYGDRVEQFLLRRLSRERAVKQ